MAFKVKEQTDQSFSIVSTRSKGIKVMFAYLHSVQCAYFTQVHKGIVGSVLPTRILPFKQNITLSQEVVCINCGNKDGPKTVQV